MQKQLLSVKQTAEFLGIGVSTVWRLSKTGKLPSPIHIGGSTRWRLSEIEAQLTGESA